MYVITFFTLVKCHPQVVELVRISPGSSVQFRKYFSTCTFVFAAEHFYISFIVITAVLSLVFFVSFAFLIFIETKLILFPGS